MKSEELSRGLDPLRMDERLRDVSWPEVREVEAPAVEAGDVMVVCGGFEERAVSVLRRVCESGRTGFQVVLVEYRPEYEANRVEEIEDLAKQAGLVVQRCMYDRRSPAGIGTRLDQLSGGRGRVWVDVSGMSRLLIVQALVELLPCAGRAVSIVYGEAAEYRPTEARFERDWGTEHRAQGLSYLSSGIYEVAATPELGSVSMVGEAIRLIAFPSFDPAQLKNLVEELQPTYAELVHGRPPAEWNRWRLDAIRRINGATLKELRGARDYAVSTRDYRETLRLLLDIYARRSMFDRIVVAPTGSKMQAVAVAIFRLTLDDVQVVYPTPLRFKDERAYTFGVRQVYQLDVPDGPWEREKEGQEEEFESLLSHRPSK